MSYAHWRICYADVRIRSLCTLRCWTCTKIHCQNSCIRKCRGLLAYRFPWRCPIP